MYCDNNIPNQLKQEQEVIKRLEKIHEPHILSLTDYVEFLRQCTKLSIPYFDPCDGGVNAEALFLFQAPGPQALKTNFISRDNPDKTANNTLRLFNCVQIPRNKTILWNIIPWPLLNSKTDNEIEKAKIHLPELLTLLPNLKAIVLVGKDAQKAEDILEGINSIHIFRTYHPSPQNINTRPYMWPLILKVFCEVSTFIFTNQD